MCMELADSDSFLREGTSLLITETGIRLSGSFSTGDDVDVAVFWYGNAVAPFGSASFGFKSTSTAECLEMVFGL